MSNFSDNLGLIFSLISLGFFGGFSHCVGMCGPFVISQVSTRLQAVELENFSHFERLKHFALLPYHFGRITTYATIGFFCSALGSMVRDFDWFRYFSAALLVVAALVFLQIFLGKKFFRMRSWSSAFPERNHWERGAPAPQKLVAGRGFYPRPKRFAFLATSRLFQVLKNVSDVGRTPVRREERKAPAPQKPKLISILFQNPRGLRGYALGIILGFIPCGLLYGAFAICATIPNPFAAALAMLCFGIATSPALFFVGSGGYFLIKNSGFKFISRAMLLLNSVMLLMMAFRLIF